MNTNVLLIHASPQEWSPETRRDLGGVLLFPTGLTRSDVDCVEQSQMLSLLAWEADLPGSRINFGQKAAARIVTERLLLGGHERLALVTGLEKSLDALKREGVHEALQSVGLSSQKLIEYALSEDGGGLEEIAARLVSHKPSVTAVIVNSARNAVRLIEYLHKHTALRVPETLSVASFHRSPFLDDRIPGLSTVDFDFFEGGKKAAEALSRAFLTGTGLENIEVTGKIIEGCTVQFPGFRHAQACIPSAAHLPG